jgi:hypothetical protein
MSGVVFATTIMPHSALWLRRSLLLQTLSLYLSEALLLLFPICFRILGKRNPLALEEL